MPSKPPPLPAFSVRSAPWWHSPPTRKGGKPAAINWSAILASLSVSFALIVSVVAWIVVHPHKTAKSVESPRVAVVPSGGEIRISPAAYSISPAAREVDAIEILPAAHHPNRQDEIANPFSQLEEAPPLPPPASRPTPPQPQPEPGPVAAQAAPQPAGETYGTQVLFLNNQAAAADLARHDHKLLFVMHISGNFEDSCFT